MSQAIELASFPEELLEKILSYCVVAPLSQTPRPAWHRTISSSSDPSTPIRGRLALLLVSKLFFRICTPLFYNTIHIFSAAQLHRLLSGALRPNPFLASHIRRIFLSGIWAEAGELLRLCSTGVRMLDLTLDATQFSPAVHGPVRDFDAEEFCDGLKNITSLTHIVVRKPNNAYLTHPKPRYVLSELAKAMQEWEDLEFADLAFRLSDDAAIGMLNSVPRAAQAQQQVGPITALTHSLSTRPKLHTFCTLLPSVWNETILRVSTNLSLERIILGEGTGGAREQGHSRGVTWSGRDFYAASLNGFMPSTPFFDGAHGIVGTGLFFMQAKKHARLSELIRAGTSIIRTRAQTLGTPMAHSPLNPSAAPPCNPRLGPCAPATPHCYNRSQSVVASAESSSTRPSHCRPQGPSDRRTFNQASELHAWESYPASSLPGPSSSRTNTPSLSS